MNYIEYTVQVYDNGEKHWYLHGKPHREDGPAIEYTDGTKFWYFQGQRHRENGPAVEYADGTKYWYLQGKQHRVDGPAVEHADGTKWWYLHGKYLSEAEFLQQTTIQKDPCADKIVEIDGKKYKLTKV